MKKKHTVTLIGMGKSLHSSVRYVVKALLVRLSEIQDTKYNWTINSDWNNRFSGRRFMTLSTTKSSIHRKLNGIANKKRLPGSPPATFGHRTMFRYGPVELLCGGVYIN